MYDVIVVGARCAGASTAMLLARKGCRVLLVDRATFPSEIPHGHFIHRHGPGRLQRWGLLDRVVATGCPPVTSMTTDFGDFPLTGKDLVQGGVAFGYAPRRGALDKVLVDAAAEAGAEIREGFVVESFMTDGDRICGVRGRARAGGAIVAERATVTVGADGRNSRLARTVGAPAYEATEAVTCWYFSYWSGVPANGLEVYVRDRRVVFAFPTNAGLFGLFVAWPASELAAVRADLEGQFMAAVGKVPGLAERVRSGRREERFCGAVDLPNFLRKPHGAGWALVGDAGCHKDPFLALGVCDAFRDAELLVDALDDGLSGRRALDQALADYERRRNEATLPEYMENLHMAQFRPLPEEANQLRAALRGNQEATNRFYMAREGMIPRESFFNPDNLRSIMTAAARSAAPIR
ncbi:MAG TPA: NAD(P)/FAD-dependent oxidoreductase [Gemmatimonadales bacterium]|nr:NAD(P)/FAD-dependent oxidoreductase [Gemmatimonadales bacterium]